MKFNREAWPNMGRVGVCLASSESFGQKEEGKIVLIERSFDEYDLWEVYFDKLIGDDSGSLSFSTLSLEHWSEEVKLSLIDPGPEETALEARIFGLREYWRKEKEKKEKRQRSWYRKFRRK